MKSAPLCEAHFTYLTKCHPEPFDRHSERSEESLTVKVQDSSVATTLRLRDRRSLSLRGATYAPFGQREARSE